MILVPTSKRFVNIFFVLKKRLLGLDAVPTLGLQVERRVCEDLLLEE